MRKINMTETRKNIEAKIVNHTLYSFYGLTENKDAADYDITKPVYVTERYRFSCDILPNMNVKTLKNMFIDMLNMMQEEYMNALHLTGKLFQLKSVNTHVMPYHTLVIDVEVESVLGAFATIVLCAGQDKHQFHASDIWVRANETAGVWKSLCDYVVGSQQMTEHKFTWCDENTVIAYMKKVLDARAIAKDCIATKGEPTEDAKAVLNKIMAA